MKHFNHFLDAFASPRFSCALILSVAILSCERTPDSDLLPVSVGTYILNNGNWGSNDSNIGIYSPSTRTYTPDAFYSANGMKLGDLGQDIVRVGDRVYIAVNGSQTVFVTDLQLKILHQINAENDGSRLSPRAFAVADGVVYVTYYEGFVGKISPDDQSVSLCKVGPNPDGLAVAGGNLYVANSGGMSYPDYNNTVSVVSLATFSETSTIEVNVNPSGVEASSDGKYVYVLSFGNYADRPSKLQVIETATGKVSDLDYASVSDGAKGPGDVLYVLCAGYDQNWNPLPGTVYKHDMATNTRIGNFVTDGTLLPDAYSVSAPSDGYVYVGCSDYKTTGDIHVFTPSGTLHNTFDSQGLNPLKAH